MRTGAGPTARPAPTATDLNRAPRPEHEHSAHRGPPTATRPQPLAHGYGRTRRPHALPCTLRRPAERGGECQHRQVGSVAYSASMRRLRGCRPIPSTSAKYASTERERASREAQGSYGPPACTRAPRQADGRRARSASRPLRGTKRFEAYFGRILPCMSCSSGQLGMQSEKSIADQMQLP